MTNAFTCVLLYTFLLKISECARKDMEGFVVGGHFATINEYPHSVFLQAHCHEDWICGSCILNQRMLITAAHCIFGCEVRLGHHIEASAGSANLKETPFKRTVRRQVVHNKYSERDVLNDIGLLLLDNDIPLGINAKRIIILSSFPFDTPHATVAGWGVVNEDTKAKSMHLKKVSQNLRSRKTCAKVGKLIPGMFCAGSEDPLDDHPAQGDSGSALIIKRNIAIGVVSFRTMAHPSLMVYTNITFYYNWVTYHSRNIFCNG